MTWYNPEIRWKTPDEPSLREYLEPTTCTNMDEPVIKDLARSLARNVKTPQELALKVWNYIVDEIKWCYEPPKENIKVLSEKSGNCFNRTNLHITLLRINGIPARFTYDLVYARFVGITIPPTIVEELPVNAIVHNSPEIYINDQWIQCDQWADRPLIPYPYQWNGEDKLCTLPPDYHWKNLGFSHEILIEPLMAQFKNAGITKKFCTERVDPYTEFVRNLNTDEKKELYEGILGKEPAENFAHHLYHKANPYKHTKCQDIKPSKPSRLPTQDFIQINE